MSPCECSWLHAINRLPHLLPAVGVCSVFGSGVGLAVIAIYCINATLSGTIFISIEDGLLSEK